MNRPCVHGLVCPLHVCVFELALQVQGWMATAQSVMARQQPKAASVGPYRMHAWGWCVSGEKKMLSGNRTP